MHFMNVRSVCHRRAVCASTSATLSEVAILMSSEHVGAIIVTRGGKDQRVVGVVTDRDIVCAQLEHVADLSRLSAGDTMTSDPLVFEEAESIGTAIAQLHARGVRRAPVVRADGSAVGLISTDDLLRYLATTIIGMAEMVARGIRREHARN